MDLNFCWHPNIFYKCRGLRGLRRPERFLCGRVDRLLPTIYLMTTRQLNVFLKPCFLGLVGYESQPVEFCHPMGNPPRKPAFGFFRNIPKTCPKNKTAPRATRQQKWPNEPPSKGATKKHDGPKSRQKTRCPKEPATKTRDTKQNNAAKQKRATKNDATPDSKIFFNSTLPSGLVHFGTLQLTSTFVSGFFAMFVSLAFQCTLARLQRLWKWCP